jgi:membrane protease YdiL (CAAX protease family)
MVTAVGCTVHGRALRGEIGRGVDAYPSVMRRWLRDGEGRLRVGWRLLVYVLLFAACGAAASVIGHSLRAIAPRWVPGLVVTVVGGGAFILGSRMLRSRMDRRPWSWMGLTSSWRTARGLAWGFATGALMLGTLFCIEWRLGWLEPTWVAQPWKLSAVLGAFFAAMGIGLMEELLLRGVFLQNLGERLALWAATLGTGVVFGLLHLANPAQHVDVAFVASAALATVMLALARFVTGTLAWAIGWHAAWDWMQDVLGVADVGSVKDYQLVGVVQRGPVAWTGQAPSIEGGGVAIAVIAVAAAALWMISRRRGSAVAWREPLEFGEPQLLSSRSTAANTRALEGRA